MFTGVSAFQACLALFLFKCGKVRVSALRLPKHCRNICRNAETRTAQGSNKHALGRVGAGKKLFQPVSRVPVRGQPGRFNPPMCRLRQPCGRPRVPGWRGVADLPLVPRPAGPVISPRASPPPVPLRSDQPARLAPVPGVRSDSADARMRISPARLLPGAEGARSRSFPWVYRGGLYAHAVTCLHLVRAREDATVRPTLPLPPRPALWGAWDSGAEAGRLRKQGTLCAPAPWRSSASKAPWGARCHGSGFERGGESGG